MQSITGIFGNKVKPNHEETIDLAFNRKCKRK